jgi:hypothetical protein
MIPSIFVMAFEGGLKSNPRVACFTALARSRVTLKMKARADCATGALSMSPVFHQLARHLPLLVRPSLLAVPFLSRPAPSSQYRGELVPVLTLRHQPCLLPSKQQRRWRRWRRTVVRWSASPVPQVAVGSADLWQRTRSACCVLHSCALTSLATASTPAALHSVQAEPASSCTRNVLC